jgi:hypothetical protein
MKKIVYHLKTRVQDFKINFKKKFEEYKEKPQSKRKSFIIGFTTVVGIFGLTLFGPVLSAVAKDIPKGNPKPTQTAPAPAPAVPPTNRIVNGALSGVAASVCSLAITSGSFAVGIICGIIVVAGILQLEKR